MSRIGVFASICTSGLSECGSATGSGSTPNTNAFMRTSGRVTAPWSEANRLLGAQDVRGADARGRVRGSGGERVGDDQRDRHDQQYREDRERWRVHERERVRELLPREPPGEDPERDADDETGDCEQRRLPRDRDA